MEDNKNQPAFPVLELKQLGDKMLLDCAAVGVTKREYFAAKAIQGLLSNPQLINPTTATQCEWRAEISITARMIADALLTELSKA